MRYDHLIDEVRRRRPQVIVEVGTWNGRRARDMLSIVPDAMYYGFDLFEAATPSTDARELNVKPHCPLDEAKRILNGMNAELIQGDTRETLPRFVERGIRADLIWMDGGHSVETAESDHRCCLAMLANGGGFLMDDYYDPLQPGFGVNSLVRPGDIILPSRDVFYGPDGRALGHVHIVRVST